MALETLKGVEKIDDENLIVMDKLREQYPEKFNESGSMDYKWFEEEIRPTNFIYLREDKNSLSFTIQNGPVKENGKNGCQVSALIDAARIIYNNFLETQVKTRDELLTRLKKGSFKSDEESEKLRADINNLSVSIDCNKNTVKSLTSALHFQMVRTADRTSREVEGTEEL